MTATATHATGTGTTTYGVLSEPTTLKIQRLLPGSVDRVWAYLTDSDLRKQWLASGEMIQEGGSPLELVWRNDELTDPPGNRPEGFPDEQRMQSRVIAIEPPRRLSISWGNEGEVTFELAEAGQKTLLTILHKRLPDRETTLSVSAGWHAHVDILADRLGDAPAKPFWDNWLSLKEDYRKAFGA